MFPRGRWGGAIPLIRTKVPTGSETLHVGSPNKNKTDKNENPEIVVYKNSQIILWSQMCVNKKENKKNPRRVEGRGN